MIVVFGTICLDRIRKIDHLPLVGGYVAVESEELRLGGEAANTAYALHQWGAPFVLAGNRVDQPARDLLAKADLANVLVHSGESPTPICDIYITPDGERTMFGVGFDRMAATLDPSEIPLFEGGWLTLDMNFGAMGLEVARSAKAFGMRLYIMDAQPSEALTALLEPGDVWQSSTDWVGRAGDVQANRRWASQFSESIGATVIVTDGGHRLVVAVPGGPTVDLPTMPPPGPVVDATGAGDRFRAGMLLGLQEGWSFSECVAFAEAAAALKLVHSGGIAPVASRSEIASYLQSQAQIHDALAQFHGR